LYNHADAKGFIKLYGLPVLVRSIMQTANKPKTASAKTSAKKRTAKKK